MHLSDEHHWHDPPPDEERAPGSSRPDEPPEPPGTHEVERQRPGTEDESADPVGDGHSDADWARDLP